MLKKLLILSAVLVFTAACGDDTEPPENNQAAPDMTAPDMDEPDMDDDETVPDMDESDMDDDMAEPDMESDMTVPDMDDDLDSDAGEDMGSVNELQICLEDCAYDGPHADQVDCDHDGLSNAEEFQLGTDSCKADTDGDGLSDLEELQLGTDPLDPDSDGDGLDDGREVEFGFDPNNPDSLNDEIDDGDRWVVNACGNPQSEQVSLHSNAPGDWLMAMSPAFTYSPLTIATATPANKLSAAAFDDPANEVSGFILSRSSNEATTPSPVDLIQSVNLGSVGSLVQGNTGGEFDTWDQNKAALRRELRRASALRSARQVRDQTLFAIAPFSSADVSDLPSSAGNTYREFRIFVSITVRQDQVAGDRTITTVAIAPADKFDDFEKVRFRVDDATNTTNFGQAGDETEVQCTTFRATEGAPAADFYWVLDQSGSMLSDFVRMKAVANEFFAELQNSPLDYRLGVTNMDGVIDGRLRNPPAWHTDLASFIQEIDDYVINCQGCGGQANSAEYGLRSAQNGITYMRSSAAPPVMRIRDDATLITIWMSDENAQTIKDGNATVSEYSNFFAHETTGFAIVSLTSGCGEVGSAYEDVALASSGGVASLCDDDIAETIEDIIFAASASASNFRLPETPVSSTLRVFKNGNFVPRSRDNGFDYFSNTNSIAFFGSYRPATPDPVANFFGDDFAVSYQTFNDRTK